MKTINKIVMMIIMAIILMATTISCEKLSNEEIINVDPETAILVVRCSNGTTGWYVHLRQLDQTTPTNYRLNDDGDITIELELNDYEYYFFNLYDGELEAMSFPDTLTMVQRRSTLIVF